MDERIRELLKELGTAINESISNSDEVNRRIQRLRDEGYNLYVVLDATIGLNRADEESHHELAPIDESKSVQFRINVNDLGFLRSVGIDPTRKVKRTRSVEPLKQSSDD